MWNFAFKHPYLFALAVVPLASDGVAAIGERVANAVRTKMGKPTSSSAAITTTSAATPSTAGDTVTL